ncbi:MAG: hypothetical protein EAZ92_04860 [Candidatus Kapaibacterium sp.]|nr:MAG: hypothetical protein EAZ92_04860 [Candidatus Kapabacteria bacterium]
MSKQFPRTVCRSITCVSLLFGFWGMFVQSLVAQQNTRIAPADRLLSQYAFENWQINDGLPQNTVQSIVRTRDGYLWLGTVEGAARFDGISFEVFSKETVPLLTNNDINVVFETKSGTLWLGAEDGSLYAKASTNAAWKRYDTTNGLPGNAIWKIFEDRAGTLLISTLGGGLVRFQNGTFTALTKKNGLQSNDISKCFEDSDGTLWFGTFGGGVHVLQNGRIVKVFKQEQGLPSNSVYDIHRDNNGTLWVGTEGGLVFLENEKNEKNEKNLALARFVPIQHETLKNSFIWTLLGDKRSANTLWIGTAKGLWRYNETTRSITDSLSALGGELPSNDIYSLAFDHEHSLWCGTVGGGLCRLKETKFIAITAKQGLATGFVWCGAQAANGEIWIGTNNVGLVDIRRNHAFPVANINKLLNAQKIYGLHVGRSGTVYMATWGSGLMTSSADGRTVQRITKQDGLAADNLWTVLEDRRGAVWVGMGSGGVQRFSKEFFQKKSARKASATNLLRSYTSADGLSGMTVRRLAEDAAGKIWVGTLNGVNVIDPARGDSIVATFSTANGLLSNSIRCIMNDNDSGGVWIGTPGGLHYVKNGAIATITKKQGLFNDNVSAILDDGAGRYWMSCNHGIFSVEKRALRAVLEKRAERVESTVYGVDDGLPSAECNAGNPGAWHLADGRIAFATTKGVALINPHLVARDSVPPPVLIEQIHADSISIAQEFLQENQAKDKAEVRINAQTARLRFHFTALGLAFPQRTRFKVRLEGYDADWIDVGAQREVSYTNLPRGKSYQFRVMARNHDGVWSPVPASAGVYLQPFFYETWWFYGISFCASIGAGFGAYRLRTLQLQRRAAELSRLVQERTTELQSTNALLRTANTHVQDQMRLVEQKSEEISTANLRLQNFIAELERTNRELKQANEFKSTMLSMASHDLKNPLSSILALVEVTMGRTADSAITEMLQLVTSSAERMLQLIIDLLDTSALELGRMDIRKVMINATPVVENVVEQYRTHAERKGQSIVWESDVQCLLEADTKRLRQVADNIISNAVKYSPKGGTIIVQLRNTTNTEGNAEVMFSVQDSGQGFSKADQEQMFGYFKRLSARPTGGESSSGMGLAIVKQIVDLHNGTIDVKTEFGVGSTFLLRFPSLNAAEIQEETERIQNNGTQPLERVWYDMAQVLLSLPQHQRTPLFEALTNNDFHLLAELAGYHETHDETEGMVMIAIQSFAENNDEAALGHIKAALIALAK